MDPASGRFTTMDSYAGCLNDPLSLHRYLYANSNPVTFKDPSGNMVVLGVALTVISSIGLAAGILSSGIHAQRYADSGATPEQMMQLYLRSIYNMILITGFCLILSTNVYAAAAFAAVGLTMQIDYIIDCFSNGDYVMGALGIAELAGMFSSIFQSCFTGDTLVATEDGNKRIDEIEVGDKVWAYNPETGETALKEVVRVYEKETDVIVHLQTTDGDIDTTTTHPFYVVGEGWCAAGDLKIGDKIYALDGTTITITAVGLEKLNKPIKVYNLEVADFHTYFVGNTGMLVHNTCYDPLTGEEVGRFIADDKGNIMIEPKGGSTVHVGKGGTDTHTLYPNGSNYHRYNPNGHPPKSNTPHGHGHLEGTGPGMKGQGPSIGANGDIVPWNSPDAHWPLK